MAKTQKTMHAAALVLFLIAFAFYFLGFVTPLVIFSLMGFGIEIAAWVTWITTSIRADDASSSEGDAT